MHALSAAGFAAIVAVLVTPTAMAIEEPRFKVLEKDGSFELREYSTHIVAETRVEAGFEDAGSLAFQRLFRYISGNNVAQQKIAMTAPVTQDGSADRGWTVRFFMPSKWSLDTLPTPDDDVLDFAFFDPDAIPWDDVAFPHIPDVISAWRGRQQDA